MANNTILHKIKTILDTCIDDMSAASWLYVANPGKDFTRNRKVPFTKGIRGILLLSSKSINCELLDMFDHSSETPSASAFVQQRKKILPEAFEFLLSDFNQKTIELNNRTMDGYRLIACDGSDVNIARNPDDPETFIQQGKGYNAFHANALYDLLNYCYHDIIVQGKKKLHERQAFNTMVDRYDSDIKTIFIMDRGYESFNTMAHIFERKQHFIIRLKDVDSNGILSAYDIPSDAEYDGYITTTLTRQHTKETLGSPEKYTILSPYTDFDYLPHKKSVYDITFRVVRFEIAPGKYEAVATDLSEEEFPVQKIKDCYMRRWGIENSFRELKYTIGLLDFHAKKMNLILQELYARVILYNFCSIVANHVSAGNEKKRKWNYKIKFVTAVNVCRSYLKHGGNESDLLRTIERYISPIRKNRTYPRKLKPKSNKDFRYRTA